MDTLPKKDYYHALFYVARSINSTMHLSQVLTSLVQSTARALDAKACSLRLLSPTRDQLVIGARYGLSDDYLSKGPVQVRRSQVDSDALDGRVVQIRDAARDPRVQYPEEMQREGIASLLVVPVMVKDSPIGVLRVYTGEPRDFTEQDVEFVQAIASLGGIAIENARVYEALEEQFQAIRKEKIPWAENFNKPVWR